MRSGLGLLVAAALLGLAGCSSPSATDTTGPQVTLSTTPPIEVCPLDRVDGCRVYGLVLAQPADVADAIAEVELHGGTALGLWRTDAVCVPSTVSAPDEPPVASNFAYVDGDQIRERRMRAVDSGQAPPITGFLIAEAYWSHWEAQWAAMREPGVEVVAIAAYLSPGGMNAIPATGAIAQIVDLDSRRTDSLDPAYAGELLLADEEFPEGFLPVPADPGC